MRPATVPEALANRHNKWQLSRKFPVSFSLELSHDFVSSALNNPDSHCMYCLGLFLSWRRPLDITLSWHTNCQMWGLQSVSLCENVCACPEAEGSVKVPASSPRTQCGSLLTVHLINEALADTPWIINEVIQLWLFPSFGERLFTQCLCLDYTIHHNWAYFMCNFMVIIVLSHLEANQTLWTSWFINILISRNVSASHIPSESREQSAESQ